MNQVVTSPPQPPSRPHGRRAAPAAASPQGVPIRRRWGRVAAGAVLALLGGWISAALYVSAGSRVGVLVAAEDLSAYQTIGRDDLRTVRVAADAGVETIAAGDADDLVGRVAATDIPQGTLLSPAQFFADEERLVTADEATVGVELAPGDGPTATLGAGDDVLVVVPPGPGQSDGPVEQVTGWVRRVGDADGQTGERQVEVVVPRSEAATVAAAADRLRIVVLEGT